MLSRMSVVRSLAARSSASTRSFSSASLSRRYVPGDLREAPEAALLVPKRRDQHASPEGRAVLADPYPFLFVLTLGRRDAPLLFGVTTLYVLVGIEV